MKRNTNHQSAYKQYVLNLCFRLANFLASLYAIIGGTLMTSVIFFSEMSIFVPEVIIPTNRMIYFISISSFHSN